METYRKKILIVDESGFCRICSAILEKEGYDTDTLTDVNQFDRALTGGDIGLVITSYPYCAGLLGKLEETAIPKIIMSDCINVELMRTIDNLGNTKSHFMIKPLDYNKFRSIVNTTMSLSNIYPAL